MEKKKKSTYSPEAQKRYNQKRKQIACTVMIDKYNSISEHVKNKGYTSISAYILDLIKKDMEL
jgi:hypothetical protein